MAVIRIVLPRTLVIRFFVDTPVRMGYLAIFSEFLAARTDLSPSERARRKQGL
jgi:hypothetical protein